MLPCSPDPSAFVVALAHCTREEIKGTPVGCELFLCRSATVGDGGLKEQTGDMDSTGSRFAAHTAHELFKVEYFLLNCAFGIMFFLYPFSAQFQ